MADAPQLRPVPDPEHEPIVLTIAGENLVVWPHEEPLFRVAAVAQQAELDLRNAENSMRGLRSALTKARTDEKAAAERKRLGHPARKFILAVFDLYRAESGRKRCKLTPERFDMVAERIAEEYERPFLLMAAVGIGSNPFVIDGCKRNDFETAFKDGASVERYANRCPADRRGQIMAEQS